MQVDNGISLLRIPLAFWISSVIHNGVIGIAWLIMITCNLRTLVIVGWAARGHWKRGLGAELRPDPIAHAMLVGLESPAGVSSGGGASDSSAEPAQRGDIA